MSPRSIVFLSVGLCLALSACASKVTRNPFMVPREQFYGGMKVIALSPLGVPGDLDDPEPVRVKFEDLITAELRQAGFTVIASAQSKALWDSMTQEMGGVFDPVTGKPDEEKLKVIRTHVFSELRRDFNCDAILFAEILAVTAKLDGDKARWDGTSQGAGKGGFWKFLSGKSHSGRIPALSLVVLLSNTDDVNLYSNPGGIQVLVKVDARDQLVPVPRSELFANSERNAKAVSLALGPLIGKKVE